jgi:hypothetical protein
MKCKVGPTGGTRRGEWVKRNFKFLVNSSKNSTKALISTLRTMSNLIEFS